MLNNRKLHVALFLAPDILWHIGHGIYGFFSKGHNFYNFKISHGSFPLNIGICLYSYIITYFIQLCQINAKKPRKIQSKQIMPLSPKSTDGNKTKMEPRVKPKILKKVAP